MDELTPLPEIVEPTPRNASVAAGVLQSGTDTVGPIPRTSSAASRPRYLGVEGSSRTSSDRPRSSIGSYSRATGGGGGGGAHTPVTEAPPTYYPAYIPSDVVPTSR